MINFNFEVMREIYEPALRGQFERDSALFGKWFGWNWKTLTPDEREQYIDRRDKERIFWADQLALHSDNPVLQLHSKGPNGCEGCDFSGYDAEPPEWPCRTVALICMGDPDFYFGG